MPIGYSPGLSVARPPVSGVNTSILRGATTQTYQTPVKYGVNSTVIQRQIRQPYNAPYINRKPPTGLGEFPAYESRLARLAKFNEVLILGTAAVAGIGLSIRGALEAGGIDPDNYDTRRVSYDRDERKVYEFNGGQANTEYLVYYQALEQIKESERHKYSNPNQSNLRFFQNYKDGPIGGVVIKGNKSKVYVFSGGQSPNNDNYDNSVSGGDFEFVAARILRVVRTDGKPDNTNPPPIGTETVTTPRYILTAGDSQPKASIRIPEPFTSNNVKRIFLPKNPNILIPSAFTKDKIFDVDRSTSTGTGTRTGTGTNTNTSPSSRLNTGTSTGTNTNTGNATDNETNTEIDKQLKEFLENQKKSTEPIYTNSRITNGQGATETYFNNGTKGDIKPNIPDPLNNIIKNTQPVTKTQTETQTQTQTNTPAQPKVDTLTDTIPKEPEPNTTVNPSKCDDPCIVDLQAKLDELLKKVKKLLALIDIEIKGEFQMINCKDADNPYKFEYDGQSIEGLKNQIIELQKCVGYTGSEICAIDTEAVVAVPQIYQIKPGTNIPQFVILSGLKKDDQSIGRADNQITVPHWIKGATESVRKPLQKYIIGNIYTTLILNDNSKIIVFCKDENEGERVIKSLIPFIDRKYIPQNLQLWHGERKGVELKNKNKEVYLKFGKFYGKGAQSEKPDWMVTFK